MAKKKRSSASGRKQPPPSSTTTVAQPSQPPSPFVEPIDPEIKQAILQTAALSDSKDYDKALDFIEESISCHPRSGQLHQVKGMIHQYMADNVEKNCGSTLKHLKDGVGSMQLAVDLLPNSINCFKLLVDLLFQLPCSNVLDRAIKVCKHGLRIEYPTLSGVEQLFCKNQVFLSNESRIESEKQTIMEWLHFAETQKGHKFVTKRVVEVVNADVGINLIVEEMKRRKKQFRETMRDCKALKRKTSNWDDRKIEECKKFWSDSLSDEKKRGFRKVKIEELERHFLSKKRKKVLERRKWLRYDLAVKLLSEAIDFADEYKLGSFGSVVIVSRSLVIMNRIEFISGRSIGWVLTGN
ncbi:hypothetical protein LWI28_003783 [Acer negundo]|uniref:DUF627 domain-containing protein n=1 Tax=Acer negundo TaxID=4023 RepID=A0AAD5I4X2_ACENE|nr:hypothetical protein LWI28_003783 [Acer negundo]